MNSAESLTFKVTGIFYRPQWIQDFIVQHIQDDSSLELKRDAGNAFDPYAIKVYYKNNRIGYVEREWDKNKTISQIMEGNHYKECRVERTVFNEDKCPIIYATIYYNRDYKKEYWDSQEKIEALYDEIELLKKEKNMQEQSILTPKEKNKRLVDNIITTLILIIFLSLLFYIVIKTGISPSVE